MKLYILKDKKPVRVESLNQWSKWFATSDDRKVAYTKHEAGDVSTVFLGMDHGLFGRPPLLFETMVFGGRLDGEQERCSTYADAVAQHERMVARVTGI